MSSTSCCAANTAPNHVVSCAASLAGPADDRRPSPEGYTEHDAAVEGLNGVLSRAGEVEALKLRKSAAERAVACGTADSRATEADEDLAAAVTAQSEAQVRAADDASLCEEATSALRISIAHQPERDAAAASVTRLEGFQTRVSGAAPLRAAAGESAVAVVDAKRVLDEAVTAHAEAEQAQATAVEAHNTAQRNALRISQIESAHQALMQAKEQASLFANASAAVATLSAARSTALETQDRLRQTQARTYEVENAAEQALASAQAAHLADRLEDGRPCPVCGSTQHPRPAGGAEEGQGLDAAWRKARGAREEADVEERQGAQSAARADGEWTQAVAQLAELKAPERDISAITQDLSTAEGELVSLRAGSDLNATQAAVDATKSQVASTFAALTTARDHHAKADKSATSDAAALEASLADVPAELRDSTSAALSVDAAVRRLAWRRAMMSLSENVGANRGSGAISSLIHWDRSTSAHTRRAALSGSMNSPSRSIGAVAVRPMSSISLSIRAAVRVERTQKRR
jgi:exonuclease SbcC